MDIEALKAHKVKSTCTEQLLAFIDMKNFVFVATQAWQSKGLRSAEKMKLSESLLRPGTLKG